MTTFWCYVCKKEIEISSGDHRERWKIQEEHLKRHQQKGDVPCWLCGGDGGKPHEGYCSGCGSSFGNHPCDACGR